MHGDIPACAATIIMHSFIMHVVLVALCIGLGYLLKIIVDGFRDTKSQLDRLTGKAESNVHVRQDLHDGAKMASEVHVPPAMAQVKLSADPDKLAQLKSAMKGQSHA